MVKKKRTCTCHASAMALTTKSQYIWSLRSEDSMSQNLRLNVHLFVFSRTRIAVLLGFSPSRKTLLISHHGPSMLKTLIKGAGHECIFLPKFHSELNPIEMVSNHLLKLSSTNSAQADNFIQYWGWCKYRYREHPKANFAAAKERLRTSSSGARCVPSHG